jgi:hypothetical protein
MLHSVLTFLPVLKASRRSHLLRIEVRNHLAMFTPFLRITPCSSLYRVRRVLAPSRGLRMLHHRRKMLATTANSKSIEMAFTIMMSFPHV